MRYDIYTLPQITIVAGQSKKLWFNLWTEEKMLFNADGCTGDFSVINYSDKGGETEFSKTLTFETDSDPEIYSVGIVELDTTDTIGLAGKYIYQLTIKDSNNEADIPKQGIFYIARNINEVFLA